MTKNQIDALKNLETERHNKEEEKIAKVLIPAQYISSIGSLARGVSGFFGFKKTPGAEQRGNGRQINFRGKREYMQKDNNSYIPTHPNPLTWTVQ